MGAVGDLPVRRSLFCTSRATTTCTEVSHACSASRMSRRTGISKTFWRSPFAERGAGTSWPMSSGLEAHLYRL
jgi:hypothetical protein